MLQTRELGNMLRTMIDYMTIGLLLFFALMGAISGLLQQLLRVLVAAGSIWVSLTYAPVIAASVSAFQGSPMMRDYGLPILMFAVLYMLMATVIKLLLKLRGKDPKISAVSRILGCVAGAVLGLLLSYFIVSVGLDAQRQTGRNMVALSRDESAVVRFVADHRLQDLFSSDGTDEMRVRIQESADSIREDLRQAGDAVGDAADDALQKATDGKP